MAENIQALSPIEKVGRKTRATKAARHTHDVTSLAAADHLKPASLIRCHHSYLGLLQGHRYTAVAVCSRKANTGRQAVGSR